MLDIIRNFTQERIDNRRSPPNILLSDLETEAYRKGYSKNEVNEQISSLEQEGLIITGQTINDTYIRLK